MPEVTFRIRWPDGQEDSCYSPSTIIRQYVVAGSEYTLEDFMGRSLEALDQAARRVQALRGHRCGLADAQAARLSETASRFQPKELVKCLSVS